MVSGNIGSVFLLVASRNFFQGIATMCVQGFLEHDFSCDHREFLEGPAKCFWGFPQRFSWDSRIFRNVLHCGVAVSSLGPCSVFSAETVKSLWGFLQHVSVSVGPRSLFLGFRQHFSFSVALATYIHYGHKELRGVVPTCLGWSTQLVSAGCHNHK